MADTRVQLEVEDWVRKEWMHNSFGAQFHRERLHLSSGGFFDFDAVSSDGKIVASISTSGALTSSGRAGVGKLLKIRADIMFLLLAEVERRVIILTEKDMYKQCLKEFETGRMPRNIEFFHASLPSDLVRRLKAARAVASKEVTPSKRKKSRS